VHHAPLLLVLLRWGAPADAPLTALLLSAPRRPLRPSTCATHIVQDVLCGAGVVAAAASRAHAHRPWPMRRSSSNTPEHRRVLGTRGLHACHLKRPLRRLQRDRLRAARGVQQRRGVPEAAVAVRIVRAAAHKHKRIHACWRELGRGSGAAQLQAQGRQRRGRRPGVCMVAACGAGHERSHAAAIKGRQRHKLAHTHTHTHTHTHCTLCATAHLTHSTAAAGRPAGRMAAATA
jgi:hypothetical protein